jgi:NAD(P)-dependent dehydrogenase (short-subunit alcohol dehydrogenase family)
VIGIGRSPERCREAEASLHRINPENKAIYLTANLSLQSEVRRLVSDIEGVLTSNGFTSLYALVNNAGLFTYWQELTAEGFETQWATNHLAPFLLTNLLLPTLQAAPAARVVTVSSNSHYGARIHWEDVQLRRKYWGLTAYGQSKLANVLFTLELNKRLGTGSSVRAFACDPGLVKTGIGAKDAPAFIRIFWNVHSKSRGMTAEKSARGITHVVLEPSLQTREEVYWKHGEPKAPSKRALDEEDARRLWALSEQMTGKAG